MLNTDNIRWPGWDTVRLIGKGSFGAVYEIKRNVIDNEDEHSAMKVISIPQAESDLETLRDEGYDNATIKTIFNEHLESIVKEYSNMKMMSRSQNVVRCEDVRYVQHDDGLGWDIFIKMELLTPLTKALPKDVDDETVAKIGIDICNALEVCKEKNIVHRDIKPQNIFVSKYGDYKLGDFGIAKTVEKTTGGTKIGTYDFMAPEVYNNQPYGTKVDMYSLGLVLYWLLNNRRAPFLPQPPETPTTVMKDASKRRRFQGETIPEPVNGSAELKRIVLKACSFDENERFSDIGEMKNALLMFVNDAAEQPAVFPHISEAPIVENDYASVEAESSKPAASKKKTFFAAIASAMVVIIAAVLGLAISGNKDNVDVGSSSNMIVTTDNNTVENEQIIPPEESTSSAEDEETPSLSEIEESTLSAEKDESTEPSFDEPSSENPAPEEEPTTKETTTKKQLPVQTEWSGWMDELPSYVTDKDYLIQNRTMYKSKSLEKESSTNKNQFKASDGWELYDTVDGRGEYGNWSSWSTTIVTESDTRDVEDEIRYRYKERETITSSSNSLYGWTLYNTTYSWSNYGNWSNWSTNYVAESDSRDVESKKQYSYRDITYKTEYTGWSGWSNWQDKYVAKSELCEVNTRTAYHYYYYTCDKCGQHWHGHTNVDCWTWAGGCGKKSIPSNSYKAVRVPTSYSSSSDFHGTGVRYINTSEGRVFAYTNSGSQHYRGPITQYQYRTRSTKQVPVYSSWSSYSDTVYYKTSTREVRERTVYHYRDRNKVPTYHFEKWNDWSDWSTTPVSETTDRKVESELFYRYREKVYITTYYFKRWTSWSDWSKTPIFQSDEIKVETKKEYRFKSK